MHVHVFRRCRKLCGISVRIWSSNSEDMDGGDQDVEKEMGAAPEKSKRRGRPRKANTTTGGGAEDEPPLTKRSKGQVKSAGKAKKEETDGGGKLQKVTDWSSISWNNLGQTSDSRSWNMKFSTWNVNGIRAWLKNGGLEYLSREAPDVFCVQETKCSLDQLPERVTDVQDYHVYWNSAQKPGYSGTGLFSKVEPLKVVYGMGLEEHDQEGRLITCEFEKFYFVTAYVPNAGEGLKRLNYRQKWDADFRHYLKTLDSSKPLILCGDLNVAHQEIDLKNPNSKTAGFTLEEREGFTTLLSEGFVDTFRHLHPDAQAFTYWSYRFNARAKNIGWRLDYFVVSQRLVKDVCDCVVRSTVLGSDHCPLVLSTALSPES